MDSRPNLDKNISITDFNEFYWLKEELVIFCRAEGLSSSGSKMEISSRIEHYLQTGEKPSVQRRKPLKKQSKFDWNTTALTATTRITDNYKNTAQVRAFFQQEIGRHFTFHAAFMAWMKANVGKTLGDAAEEWKRIRKAKKNNTAPKEIPPQLEYNTYIRDYFTDNPDGNRTIGIKLWKIKKTMRGDNKYRPSDLKLLE